MTGLDCMFDNNISLLISDMLDPIGFYNCELTSSDSYLGLLPVRNKKGYNYT